MAEQRLSGCNARDPRVTAEWLKTRELVLSTDLSKQIRWDASGKVVGDYQEGPPSELVKGESYGRSNKMGHRHGATRKQSKSL